MDLSDYLRQKHLLVAAATSAAERGLSVGHLIWTYQTICGRSICWLPLPFLLQKEG